MQTIYTLSDGRESRGHETLQNVPRPDGGLYTLPPGWLLGADAEALALFGVTTREEPDPPAPEPGPLLVPFEISRPQAAREMFLRNMISRTEMLAMTMTGAPPAMVEAMFAGMPQPGQDFARADFARYTYQRGNPLLGTLMTQAILAQTPGATEAEIVTAIDDFFRAAFGH